jgi:TonB family protein
MKSLFLRHFGFALALTLWLVPVGNSEEDQFALRNIFERARNLSNLRAKGTRGFYLEGDVRIWMKKDSPSQGKYQFLWTPEGKWKEEITFKDYKRVRVGDGERFWQVRSQETESNWIFQLDWLMRIGWRLNVEKGDKLKRLHPEKIEGMDAECIKGVSANGSSETFCFQANSGELLRYTPEKNSSEVPWRVQWREYSQFQQWGDKSFPRTLRGYNGKHLIIELKLDETASAPQLAPNFFDAAKDATVWDDCPDRAAWKVKERKQPAYPQSARARGVQGTVVLYAIIEEDGHLSNVRIVQSAGTELDQSAVNSVSQWRYERTDSCARSRGRTEIQIDIMFWLQ